MNWSEFITKIENGLLGQRYSDLELANKTGIGRELIYKLRTGQTKRPQQRTKALLEAGLNIQIDDTDPENITYSQIASGFENEIPIYEYPILAEVYAGEPDQIDIEYPEGDKKPFTYYRPNHRCFALKVNGRSMESTLKDGDIVLVDMDLTPIDGDLVAVKLKNGHQYIKRFKDLNYAFIQLSSDNSEYGVRIIDKNDIEAIYPVVQIIFNLRNGSRR